jgi:LacI family transcriptional regulator
MNNRKEEEPCMAVTIKDIAERAGVSFSTVSKALRNSPLVQEKTRRKILAIAEEMGYRPNIAARRLVSNKSWTVGIAWPSLHRVTLSLLVTRIHEILEEHQYTTLLSVNRMDKAIDAFLRLQVDAILLFGDGGEAKLDVSEAAQSIPMLYYGVAGTMPLPTVDVMRGRAIALAVRHLEELGHSRIAYIGGTPEHDALQQEKLTSYRREMKARGWEPNTVIAEKMDSHEGYWAAKPLLAAPDRPTAVIGGSYDLTRGILRAAVERGLRVPEDLSVVSYDLLPISNDMEEAVTSVGVQLEQIAQTLANTLLRMIRGESPAESIMLEPEIIVLSSTARVPERES